MGKYAPVLLVQYEKHARKERKSFYVISDIWLSFQVFFIYLFWCFNSFAIVFCFFIVSNLYSLLLVFFDLSILSISINLFLFPLFEVVITHRYKYVLLSLAVSCQFSVVSLYLFIFASIFGTLYIYSFFFFFFTAAKSLFLWCCISQTFLVSHVV